MSLHTFDRIAIIGLGLIGGSLAGALKEHSKETVIFGVNPDESVRKRAIEKGWVDDACGPEDDKLKEFVMGGCQLVVIATPADAAAFYFERFAQWGYEGIVTDAASTKTRICADAEAYLGDKAVFIPGHPMAGSEVNGLDGARPDLFEGCHWILCPDEDTPPDAFTELHELLTSLSARVIVLDRNQHDRSIAVVSHVPHFTAAALVELAARHAGKEQTLYRLAAGGFKDSTRIAAGSAELWTGIAFDNKQALAEGLAEISDIISQFRDALVSNDRKVLEGLLDETAHIRRSIPAKWMPSTDNLLEVRVPMANRKGAVAEVTAIASKVGCNIQSIDIDHITADSAVLSMIFTDEGDIGKLSCDLIGAGYAVSLSPLSAKE